MPINDQVIKAVDKIAARRHAEPDWDCTADLEQLARRHGLDPSEAAAVEVVSRFTGPIEPRKAAQLRRLFSYQPPPGG